MVLFPLEPMFAKAVIDSVKFECTEEVVTIVSMLSVENVFHTPREKINEATQSQQRFAAYSGKKISLSLSLSLSISISLSLSL